MHISIHVVQVCHCWCRSFSASDCVSPRAVTIGIRPFPLAVQHVYPLVSPVCHWWCRHVAFLFICFPGLSLLVSALFRWPCRNSIHCVSQVYYWWYPPISGGHVIYLFVGHVAYMRLSFRSVVAGVRPFPLASHAACLFICLPGLSDGVPAMLR